jgi:AcrR family transcriptional regulator
MPSTRRLGARDSRTRAQLLDAAEQLMLEEGYAAVTSRRVGNKAELKPQLVHYYFRTMDDLFLEVFRRHAEKGLDRFQRALESDRSLQSLWRLSSDPTEAVFTIEFIALANHRKEIRAEVAQYAHRFRKMQLDALACTLADHGIPPDDWPPLVVLIAITGISQMLALEDSLGFTGGHAEAVAFVQRHIDELEGNSRESTLRRKTRPMKGA